MARGGGHFCYAGWAAWGELRGGGKRAAPKQEMLSVVVCVVYLYVWPNLEMIFECCSFLLMCCFL